MKFTKDEIQEAKEEYDKIIFSLRAVTNNFKGHWEDKKIENKFNKEIIEKGDKEYFTKYYFENKALIEGAQNINIENIYDDEFE